MKIYKFKPVFDRDTGVKIDDELIVDKTLCDFTEKEIGDEEIASPPYTIKFKYNYDSEPDYYYDDVEKIYELLSEQVPEKDLIDAFHIRAEIAEEEYCYSIINEYFADATILLVQKWINEISDKGSPFYECPTLGCAARIQRAKLIEGFLKDRIYTPKQLGLLGS